MRSRLFALVLVAACGVPKHPPTPSAPPPPTCDAIHVSIEGTATNDEPVRVLVNSGDPSATRTAEVAAGRAATDACRDDHWRTDAIDCLARAETDDAQRTCVAALPAAQAGRLRARVDDAVAATKTAAVVRGKPVAWTDLAADTGVPACDDYLRAFNAYMHCDKISAEVRDASATAAQQMVGAFQALKDPSVPADAKQQAGEACAQANDALRASSTQLGCPLP
jgi:hypothetical protein